MAFDPISAAISGGLGLASAFMGSNAASSAGKAQAAALDRATAAQQAQAAQTRADLAPWRETGTGALYHLADLYGVPRSDGAGGMTAGSDFTGTPGYQFRFGEGLRGVNNSASAAGLIDSGSRLRALTDYGQGQAANEWGDYKGTIQSLAGVGQTAVGQQVAANQSNANSLANLYSQQGANAASTQIGQANAITGGLNNALIGYAYLNR